MKNKHFFSLLTYDEQEKYKENFKKSDCNIDIDGFDTFMNLDSPNFMSFLKKSFVFDFTNEGFDYWFQIAQSNRCFEQWVHIVYNDLNTNEERSISMPLSYANTIADEMLINGLIGSYKIKKDEI